MQHVCLYTQYTYTTGQSYILIIIFWNTFVFLTMHPPAGIADRPNAGGVFLFKGKLHILGPENKSYYIY
jgi:hypothetical protein